MRADPFELHSLHDDPAHAGILAELRDELGRLANDVGDSDPHAGTSRHPALGRGAR